MNKKTKALVKDLQLQIDYLIGYAPGGNHWKQEYHIRKTLIDQTLCDSSTPPEIVDKLNRILDSLYRLQNKDKHEQGYINYASMDSIITHKFIVHDYSNHLIDNAEFALEDSLMSKRPVDWQERWIARR